MPRNPVYLVLALILGSVVSPSSAEAQERYRPSFDLAPLTAPVAPPVQQTPAPCTERRVGLIVLNAFLGAAAGWFIITVGGLLFYEDLEDSDDFKRERLKWMALFTVIGAGKGAFEAVLTPCDELFRPYGF